MKRQHMITLGILGDGASGPTFPLTLDFSTLGSLPSYLVGSDTFSISPGVGVVNTPEFGTELLADPGLEGNYTGGVNDSLLESGGAPSEISSGVHGGSKAQGWVAGAGGYLLSIKTAAAQQWYKLSGWYKRTAGSGAVYATLYQTMQLYSRNLSSASYVQLGTVIYADAVANLFAQHAGVGSGTDTIVMDDISLKQLTKTSLVKLVNGAAGYTVKIKATWDSNNIIAVVSHSDGTLDNCLIAYYIVASAVYTFVVLDQIVAGVRTNLVASWSNHPGAGGGGTPTSDQWLEIRYTDTNKVTLFHNDIAVGTEQSIPAELQANTYYGIMDTGGGNSVNRFFAGDLSAVNIGTGGSSNTYSATGYFYDLYNTYNPKYLVTRKEAAANGQGIASYTLPNYANLAGSIQVIADTTGDATYPDSLWYIEAFIRKCYADGYKLLIAAMPRWTDADLNNGQVNTPANLTLMGDLIVLLDHYGVPHVDMLAQTQSHVTGGGDLADYWADQLHMTDAGQLVAAAGLAPHYVTGGTIPSPLAARVYAESEVLE